MLVKGAVINATVGYVKAEYPEWFDAWLAALSTECREVMADSTVVSWYPLRLAMVEPTEKLCKLVGASGDAVAWDLGRFSADFALRGVFRFFVRLGSPAFIIKRASRVFTTYYTNAVLRVPESGPSHAVVHILEFPEPHRLVDRRMGGFMERAVEISGAKNVKGTLVSSLADGDERTELRYTWE